MVLAGQKGNMSLYRWFSFLPAMPVLVPVPGSVGPWPLFGTLGCHGSSWQSSVDGRTRGN